MENLTENASSSVGIATMASSDDTINDVEFDGKPLSRQRRSDNSLLDTYIFTNNDLTDRERIGSGGFGVVYRRQWHHNGNVIDVAEKQLSSDRAIER